MSVKREIEIMRGICLGLEPACVRLFRDGLDLLFCPEDGELLYDSALYLLQKYQKNYGTAASSLDSMNDTLARMSQEQMNLPVEQRATKSFLQSSRFQRIMDKAAHYLQEDEKAPRCQS
jgi:hypothetical protein